MPLVSMTPKETSEMIEEVRKHGFDPAVVRCCVPSFGLPGSVRGVKGCDQADRCNFHLTKHGGFRNLSWRPKNVCVYIKPDKDMPNQNEVVVSCFHYCQKIADRVKDSQRDNDQFGWGEVIQIVAQEGEEYTEIQTVKVSATDPNSATMEKVVTKTVPEYKHPSQLAGTQGQREMQERAKQRVGNAEETGPPRVKKPAAEEKWADEQEADIILGETPGA